MTRLTRIYVLKDPDSGEIRYVGKTVMEARQRLSAHISEAFSGSTRSARWISVLLRAGKRPEIEVVETCQEKWAEREAHWIAHYRAILGARLTNLTLGGEGSPGNVRTRKSVELSIIGIKASWTLERKLQAAKLLGERNRTVKPVWTPERRAALSERNRVNWTPERRAAESSRLAARNAAISKEESRKRWTPERRAMQAEVCRRVQAKRWAKE